MTGFSRAQRLRDQGCVNEWCTVCVFILYKGYKTWLVYIVANMRQYLCT